jgi:uncharacterized membrane protein
MNSYYELVKNPVLIISLVAIIIAKVVPPRRINSWYGYRTKRSMKNQRTWDFAQQYSTTRILYVTLILLIVQIVINGFFETYSLSRLGVFMLWLTGVLFVIYVTEMKLEKM